MIFKLSYPSSLPPQLVLGGLVDEDVGLSLLRDMLHHVVETDRLIHGRPYLTVVLSFVRHHAEDFAAILPRRQQLLLRKHSIKLPNSQVGITPTYCLNLLCVALIVAIDFSKKHRNR